MTRNESAPELDGISLAHARLPELIRLADAARPFYEWVEEQAASLTGREISLSDNLMEMDEGQIRDLVLTCHLAPADASMPALFDGIGRQYDHSRAVYSFFAWMLRDAPQQRLQPILTRIRRDGGGGKTSREVQATALARLCVAYRDELATFEWPAIREVIVDRLEGSRRSIKGHQSEVVVRTALSVALQKAYEDSAGYGRFDSIKVHDKEARVLGETFDVCVDLLRDGVVEEKLLIPVKTRETEGGGHSHLFTRDIKTAMDAVRKAQGSDITYWLAAFIVAENWAPNEKAGVRDICDFAIALEMNPTAFETLDVENQRLLDAFVSAVLGGDLEPRAVSGSSGAGV